MSDNLKLERLSSREASELRVRADAAFGRLKKAWEDWLTVGNWLLEGRTQALIDANTNQPYGRAYTAAFGKWLAENPNYSDERMGKPMRNDLAFCMENRADIETWRSNVLTRAQRDEWASPRVVKAKYQTWVKQQEKIAAAARGEVIEKKETKLDKANAEAAMMNGQVKDASAEIERLKADLAESEARRVWAETALTGGRAIFTPKQFKLLSDAVKATGDEALIALLTAEKERLTMKPKPPKSGAL